MEICQGPWWLLWIYICQIFQSVFLCVLCIFVCPYISQLVFVTAFLEHRCSPPTVSVFGCSAIFTCYWFHTCLHVDCTNVTVFCFFFSFSENKFGLSPSKTWNATREITAIRCFMSLVISNLYFVIQVLPFPHHVVVCFVSDSTLSPLHPHLPYTALAQFSLGTSLLTCSLLPALYIEFNPLPFLLTHHYIISVCFMPWTVSLLLTFLCLSFILFM